MEKPSRLTRLALFSVICLGACGGRNDLHPDAESRLLEGAERIQQLMQKGDFAAVLAQIPDDLFPGGPEGKRAALDNMPAGTREGTIGLAANMKLDSPKTIHRVGEWHVCVVPYESSVNGFPMKACHIAVSRDRGATWGFISGSKGGVAGLRVTAPQLLAAIEDEIQAVVVEDRLP